MAASSPETQALADALRSLLPLVEQTTERAFAAQALNRRRPPVAGLADPEPLAQRLNAVVVRLDEATALLRTTLRELGA